MKFNASNTRLRLLELTNQELSLQEKHIEMF